MSIFHYPTRFERNGDGVDFLQYNFYSTKMWGWFVIFNVRWLTHVMQRWLACRTNRESNVKFYLICASSSQLTHTRKKYTMYWGKDKNRAVTQKFMIKKRVWILSSNEFPGDQTDFVNLDKHLTSEDFGRKLTDAWGCSESTAPVLALNQKRTWFKCNRCTMSAFIDGFECAFIIVSCLRKQTRHIN